MSRSYFSRKSRSVIHYAESYVSTKPHVPIADVMAHLTQAYGIETATAKSGILAAILGGVVTVTKTSNTFADACITRTDIAAIMAAKRA